MVCNDNDIVFCFKQKTAYEMRISDWSSDVCSSDLWIDLLPAALAISVVGLVESLSVAQSLAAKRRQKIDPDQELRGLGAANLAAAFSGGYPVTGGFARSVVNFAAGANTQLAGILTAALIAAVALFSAPAFYYLPNAITDATLIPAVLGLADFAQARPTRRSSNAHGPG